MTALAQLRRAGNTRQTRRLQPGQIVAFRQGAGKGQSRPGIGYRVNSVDAKAGTVRLFGRKGKPLTWSPSVSSGDQADAFVEVAQEFRIGDRAQFTRNDCAALYTDSRAKLTEALGLRNGAKVGAIDETMGLAIPTSKSITSSGVAIPR